MIDYKSIGKQIQTQRIRMKLTQEAVAERANITTVYLSKIENGHVKPTIDLLDTLCNIVNTDISFIFSDACINSKTYQNEKVLTLFNSCKPEIKPVVVELVEKLSKI